MTCEFPNTGSGFHCCVATTGYPCMYDIQPATWFSIYWTFKAAFLSLS